MKECFGQDEKFRFKNRLENQKSSIQKNRNYKRKKSVSYFRKKKIRFSSEEGHTT